MSEGLEPSQASHVSCATGMQSAAAALRLPPRGLSGARNALSRVAASLPVDTRFPTAGGIASVCRRVRVTDRHRLVLRMPTMNTFRAATPHCRSRFRARVTGAKTGPRQSPRPTSGFRKTAACICPKLEVRDLVPDRGGSAPNPSHRATLSPAWRGGVRRARPRDGRWLRRRRVPWPPRCPRNPGWN
jgi:hypothetical protein